MARSWLPTAMPPVWLAAAALLLAYTAPPLTDHPDTVRDLLAARDCADDGHCLAAGAQASFGQLRSGSLWPAALAALRAAGAPAAAAHWLVLGADALTVALAARLGGPLAASALLAALLLITREHLVWSPALMPLQALLVAAAWRTAQRSQRRLDWLFLGLAFGVQADLHPVGIVFSGAGLLVALWQAPSARPVWPMLGGAALALAILQPETAALNVAGLWRNAPLAVAGAAGLGLLGLARAVRGHPSALSAARLGPAIARMTRATPPPWPDTPAASAAAAASLALLIAGILQATALQPRYFLAALPPIALLLGPIRLPRLGQIGCAAVPLALAAALGPAEIGVGHPWPVVEALASEIAGQGHSWPTYLYQTQADGCRRLDAALAVELPAQARPSLGAPGWQVIDLDRAASPHGSGWRPVAEWHQGRAPIRSWLRQFEPWVQRSQGEICLSSAAKPHACEPIQPGTRLDLGRRKGEPTPSPADTPWHLRTFPASVSLSANGAPAQTIVSLPLRAARPGRRTLQVLDLPARRCPWQIRAVRGLSATISPERSSAALTATATAVGSIELTRSWGPGCDDATEWQYGPPCLLEKEGQP